MNDMIARRYMPNVPPQIPFVNDTDSLLNRALEDIVTKYPPPNRDSEGKRKGVFSGPVGLAYLFLHVSAKRPELLISGKDAIQWATEYIQSTPDTAIFDTQACGLVNNTLARDAVYACITKDLTDVKEAVSAVPQVLQGDYVNELMCGRAGALYLLRMMRHWVPQSRLLVEEAIAMISEKVLDEGLDWSFRGTRYLGAVHGDIGIITQLVLSNPLLAPRLTGKLEQILELQLPNGNWPIRVDRKATDYELVQFCHGAPGMVFSLLSLRSFFPSLDAKIRAAIQRGQEFIWEEGLLRKEPSLCHGILGNALALPSDSRRGHFLALTTPAMIAELKAGDPSLFEAADYGAPSSTLMGYAPSAAWAWLVCGQSEPPMLLYNDV